MTLTHILPSLRSSIPDPIDPNLWPEVTTTTTTAVIPGSHGHPSPTERAAAIVVRVTEVTRTKAGLRVELDASLDAVRPILSETRLIGRASTAKTASAALVTTTRDASREDVLATGLPADLRAGDLLAIPCQGEVALRQLRPRIVPDTVPVWMPAESSLRPAVGLRSAH
jgi:hypothetical protein